MQMLLEWLSEAEQTLRFRGVLPEEAETLQALLHTHRNFMGTVEDKRADVNKAAGMGEGILTLCHPESITTIKHWITIIRARFEEVTWLLALTLKTYLNLGSMQFYLMSSKHILMFQSALGLKLNLIIKLTTVCVSCFRC